MIVPQHLRLTLFCAKVHTVATLEGRAWVCGTKDDIDLDFENVQELVDLGILEISPDGVVRDGGSLDDAFTTTFADGVLPQHPGLQKASA